MEDSITTCHGECHSPWSVVHLGNWTRSWGHSIAQGRDCNFSKQIKWLRDAQNKILVNAFRSLLSNWIADKTWQGVEGTSMLKGETFWFLKQIKWLWDAQMNFLWMCFATNCETNLQECKKKPHFPLFVSNGLFNGENTENANALALSTPAVMSLWYTCDEGQQKRRK